MEYTKKVCRTCETKISSNPGKNDPLAFAYGYCNVCWKRHNPTDDIKPTSPTLRPLEPIDMTDPANRQKYLTNT